MKKKPVHEAKEAFEHVPEEEVSEFDGVSELLVDFSEESEMDLGEVSSEGWCEIHVSHYSYRLYMSMSMQISDLSSIGLRIYSVQFVKSLSVLWTCRGLLPK